VISRNRVRRSERYGVAVFPTARFVVFDPGTPEPGPPWRPHGNRVARNVVTGSGRADLALALGSGRGNCFSRNVAVRSLPHDSRPAAALACRRSGPLPSPRTSHATRPRHVRANGPASETSRLRLHADASAQPNMP
jgi:hypothetical protein